MRNMKKLLSLLGVGAVSLTASIPTPLTAGTLNGARRDVADNNKREREANV